MTSLDPQNPLYGPPVENLCVRVWVLNRKFVESVCEVNEYHISQIFLHPLDFGVCQRYFWHLMCLCRIFWLLRILIKKSSEPLYFSVRGSSKQIQSRFGKPQISTSKEYYDRKVIFGYRIMIRGIKLNKVRVPHFEEQRARDWVFESPWFNVNKKTWIVYSQISWHFDGYRHSNRVPVEPEPGWAYLEVASRITADSQWHHRGIFYVPFIMNLD